MKIYVTAKFLRKTCIFKTSLFKTSSSLSARNFYLYLL